MYSIDFDARTRILHITAEGFWTLGTLAAFSATILARGFALKLRYGRFATMNDVRRMPVQANEVAKGLEYLLVKTMEISTAPIATVVGTHLNRLQAERVLKADHSRVFMDWNAAVAWLDEAWVKKEALAA